MSSHRFFDKKTKCLCIWLLIWSKVNSRAGDQMPKNYKERSLIEFQKEFPDDEACAKHIAEQRWPNGFVCPQCGHTKAWYLSQRNLFDCKNCRFQTSAIAGTIFHGTRTPLVNMVLDDLSYGDGQSWSVGSGNATASWYQTIQNRLVDGSQDPQSDGG